MRSYDRATDGLGVGSWGQTCATGGKGHVATREPLKLRTRVAAATGRMGKGSTPMVKPPIRQAETLGHGEPGVIQCRQAQVDGCERPSIHPPGI